MNHSATRSGTVSVARVGARLRELGPIATLLFLGGAYYVDRLMRWLAYDDEGGYLYAAWRISLGELPYRDFLTPQLPAFLYPGALILALTGNSVLAARLAMTLLVLATTLLTYLTVRRLWGVRPALLATLLMLVQSESFWAARFFRPEAPMLFWAALGVYLFVRAYAQRRRRQLPLLVLGERAGGKGPPAPPNRGKGLPPKTVVSHSESRSLAALGTTEADRAPSPHAPSPGTRGEGGGEGSPAPSARGEGLLLALSGAAMGLAMASKLFGALPLAGIGLFLLAEFLATRDWRDTVCTGLTVGLPFVAVVAVIFGAFVALTPETLGAVLGHHLRQGQGMPVLQVVAKALGLYWDYVRHQPVYVALGLGGAILSLRRARGVARVYAWQLPTALVFLLLTRDLQARHLTYLVPALAALGGLAVDRLWAALSERLPRRRGFAGVAVVAAVLALALWPHVAKNALVASWRDDTTPEWVAYIQARTAPDDVVVSDYPGINFYAQRRTTRLAAGISEGAASSGQIMGSDLIAEIEASGAPMVLFNIAHGGHQFVSLRDHPALREYLLQHYHLSERRSYDTRLIEVFGRQDFWPGAPLDENLGGRLRLTGVQWLAPEAAPGEDLRLNLRWTALAPMDVDYGVTLRLMDDQGHAWGLGHKLLMDIQDKSLWIEGLEYADLRPTSEWPVGEATIAAFELPVDPGTPPGEYQVIVRVHPQGAWDGLPVLGVHGAPQGYDIAIGRARVLPAALPVDTARLTMDERHSVDAAPGLTLLGHSSLPGEVRPGDAIALSACWQAQEAALPPYGVRLTLEGDERVWGELRAALSQDDYPTPRWREGEALCGRYDLIVDAETPNGPYTVQVAVVDVAGVPVAPPHAVGVLQVAGRQRLYNPPVMAHPVGARLGGAASLLGYDLAPDTLRPGETLDLTLYWRAEARMGTPYKVFTHIIDGADRVWGQEDGEPMGGAYPTTGWLPGEIVIDGYQIQLDADAPEGEYHVEVGMYDPATLVRLPAAGPDGAPLAHDRILFGPVHVVR